MNQEFHLGLPRGAGVPALGLSSMLFQAHWLGTGSEAEQLGLRKEASLSGGTLTCYGTVLVPFDSVLQLFLTRKLPLVIQ